MNRTDELFAVVGKFVMNRPNYRPSTFLPTQILELGVLNLLETGDQSGATIIRDLIPLSKQARGSGVHYPLLHNLEAEGIIRAYYTNDSLSRVYALTEKGYSRLYALRNEFVPQYQQKLEQV